MNRFFTTISIRPLRRHWRIGAAAAIAAGSLISLPHRGATARGGSNPNILWYVPTDAKVVALTFDDGPAPSSTPKILATLNQFHDKATFFVLGRQAEQYPELVRQEIRDGMEVGNHTWAHINLKQHSAAYIRKDLVKSQTLLERLTQKPVIWMRPPYGAYNRQVLQVVDSLNLKMVLWSWTEDSRDWANPGRDVIVSRVIKHIQPGDIVLFHDAGGNRSETVAALPIILRDLQMLGYRTVTISELVRYRSPSPSPASPSVSREQSPAAL